LASWQTRSPAQSIDLDQFPLQPDVAPLKLKLNDCGGAGSMDVFVLDYGSSLSLFNFQMMQPKRWWRSGQ
jgi:hypothetical protein